MSARLRQGNMQKVENPAFEMEKIINVTVESQRRAKNCYDFESCRQKTKQIEIGKK